MNRDDIERLTRIETRLDHIVDMLSNQAIRFEKGQIEIKEELRAHTREDDQVHLRIEKETKELSKKVWVFSGGVSVLALSAPYVFKIIGIL